MLKILDRFIIGEGADSQTEYLIHTREPRFICVVGSSDDIHDGISFSNCEDVLHSFLWLSEPPCGDEAKEIMRDAFAALARYT